MAVGHRLMLVVKTSIVIGAVAATTVALAATAWAGQNVAARYPIANGDPHLPGAILYGAFHHKGDWLQLVNSCRGWGIGYIQVRSGAETKTYYVAKKGQAHRCGERWINRNFREGQPIGIRVCLVRRGRDKCVPWRWGIA
jgi:hypothetical protein